MGLLFLGLAAVLLCGPLGASGDTVPWWSVDSGPLSPPHGSSLPDIGMNQWFTVYPENYKHDEGSKKTPSTVKPDTKHNGGYDIIDLRS